MAEKKTGKKTTSLNKKTSSARKNAGSAAKKKNSVPQNPKNKEDKEREVKASIEKIYRKKRLTDEVIAICMVAVGIFLILSVMTDVTGKFGLLLSMVLKGLFGIGAYILPFYVIIYSLLVLMNYMAHLNGRTVFFSLLMFIDICVLNSARFKAANQEFFSISFIKNSFTDGINLDSGGFVGMFLAWLIIKIVALAGLIIIGILIMIISIMFIGNTPISVFLENHKKNIIKKRLLKELHEKEMNDTLVAETELELNMPHSSHKQHKEKETTATLPETVPVHPAEAKNSRRLVGLSAPMNPSVKPAGEYEISKGAVIDETDIPSFINKHNEKFFDYPDKENATDMRQNQRVIMEYMNDDSLFAQDATYEPQQNDRFDAVINRAEKLAEVDKKSQLDDGFEPIVPMKKKRSEIYDIKEPLKSRAPEMPSSEHELLPDEVDKKLSRTEMKSAILSDAKVLNSEIAMSNENEHHYELPPISLLRHVEHRYNSDENAVLAAKAAKLEQVLHDFGVKAHVINVQKGSSVTRYEIQPETGVKVNSIVRLSDDIALNLEARSLRIEAPIPGKAAVGIEVENEISDVVTLREMIESDNFKKSKSKISFVVGEDISGNSIIGDLKGMPHLLIAGSTGSGKSVCINSMIMSILYNATPDEVKLILIDPKVVELGNYNGIPHMLIPVVTDPSKAAAALAWAVQEMNSRYKKFAEKGVRDLKAYNEKIVGKDDETKPLPQIVIIIDELADLMMAAAKQVEESICRLAQLARAAGMHLVVATQRPSVDVVTGLIKANIPSRIAFAVSSQVDSRTILDRAGAEKLVGKGDMLYYPLGKAQPMRLQGPFVTDDEVGAVIEFWKSQADEGSEKADVKAIMSEIETVDTGFNDTNEDEDELMEDAIALVLNANQASASMLQRRFRIGYNRAGRLIDMMETRGIIGASEGSKPRKVLISKEEYELMTSKPSDADNINEDSFNDNEMSSQNVSQEEPKDIGKNNQDQ